MNKMRLVIGDWSGEGHSEYFDIFLKCNHTIKEIQDAYKASVLKTGLGFDNYDKDAEGTYIVTERHICVEYESYGTLTAEVQSILKQFGCSDALITDYQDNPLDKFVELWFWFVSLSLPDLEYEEINDFIPTINGYWDKNMNTTFGYGLFS